MKTVWRFTTAGKKEKQFGKHPTQKPIALIDRCIRASTHPNDVVLDPFSGTASTGVAALKVGRRFIGIEVDKDFAEIGKKRLSEVSPSVNGVTYEHGLKASHYTSRLLERRG